MTPGDRLGPYEIVEQLGAGGMGEVWRARDRRLDRDVAIKVLPLDFASDPEALARFEREAKLLAQLNHPHIAGIYGLEDADGTRFIVMECVEGATLADRIRADGRVELDDALEIARQIALALEAAHAAGIVHRDLKPANVKVTDDGTVKVLDFGLAKGRADASASELSPGLSQSPTVAATRTGVIMGTAAYMSPEQARGKKVDNRTDVWAFGCVLFEMLTGRRAFQGDTVTDVLAAIVKEEPDWSTLPAGTPAGVRWLLRSCLSKSLGDRLQHIGDARLLMLRHDEGSAAPAPSDGAGRRPPPSFARVALLMAATALTAALLTSALVNRPAPDSTSWLEVLPPRAELGEAPEPVLSPDGEALAFRALNDSGDVVLWVRRFDSPGARELPNTEDAVLPFWSPDGSALGFFYPGGSPVRRVDLSDGQVRTVADAPNGRGGSWGPDGIILYVPTPASPVLAVSAAGDGGARPVTTLGDGIVGHWHPQFLPGTRRFLYVAKPAGRAAPLLYLGSLDSPEAHEIEGIHSRAEYVDGYLFFGEGDVLYAQRFDPDTGQLGGERMRVAQGLGLTFGEIISYSFSAGGGAVVYAGGSPYPRTELTVIDRQGWRLTSPGISGEIAGFDLVRDPARVALERRDPVANRVDVTLVDLADGIPRRFEAGDPWAATPYWSPEGDRIAFVRNDTQLVVKSVHQGTETREIDLNTSGAWLSDWSTDGRFIVFQEYEVATRSDVSAFDLEGDETVTRLLNSTSSELEPKLSPDGRWLAFASDESGEFEIYVQSFPAGGDKQQVSVGGGRRPRWRADSGELYYVRGDGMFTAATVQEGNTGLRVMDRQPLFAAPRLIYEQRSQYAVLDAEGQRFLFNEITTGAPRSITVIGNWRASLDAR